MAKPIYIFSINANYTRCEVWHGLRSSHRKLGSSTIVPDKGQTRQERYELIANWLVERFDLPRPSYGPTKSEKRS